MKQSVTKGMGLAKACCFTAILNSVFSPVQGQEVVSARPDDVSGWPEPVLNKYGPFDIRPHVRARVLYDDNIFIRPSGEEDDLILNLSPGVMLGAGDYIGHEASMLTLEYAPNFILFTDNYDESSIDQDAKLVAELNQIRWRLTLSQAYQDLSGTQTDVATRVDREIYTTTALFEYEISPKTSADVSGRMLVNDYESNLNDFNEWTFGGGGEYKLTPKLSLGAGVVFGFLDVRQSVNQTYQQVLLRGAFEVSEKLTARGTFGGELREFQGDGEDDKNVVFSLGGTYKPFSTTTVAFDAYRRVQNSVVISSANYTTLGVSVGIRQTIREKYGVHLALGYENAKYSINEGDGSASRDDDYVLARVGADWAVTERLALGVYYQYRRNDSSEPFVEFKNNQVGLTASYQF